MNVKRGQEVEALPPVISVASWDLMVTLVSIPQQTTSLVFVPGSVLVKSYLYLCDSSRMHVLKRCLLLCRLLGKHRRGRKTEVSVVERRGECPFTPGQSY